MLLSLLLIVACKKDDDDDDDGLSKDPGLSNESADTLKVNRFILDCAETFYLWADDIDWEPFEKKYQSYTDPQKLFDDVLHEKDKWSTLTNDFDEMESSFTGVSTSFGWVPIRVTWNSAAKTFFYIILFVYPNSPAEKAGIKRGDFIVKIDGKSITNSNYTDMYYASSISVTKGTYTGSGLTADATSISLTATKEYQNPMLKDTVYVKGSKRIGYLCYTDFLLESEPALTALFRSFKSRNITDLIIDLRYNGGGYVHTSVLLSSLIAPANAIQGGKTVQQYQIWNNLLTDYYQQWYDYYIKEGRPDKAEDYRTVEYFTDTLTDANPGLTSVYFLTTEFTASASEATIISLQPFMTVKTVGETTAGKFVGGGLLRPEDVYEPEDKDYYNSFNNWGMYLMYFSYTNSTKAEFLNGLEPTYPVMTDTYNETAEDYFDLQPFGSENDPLVSEALYRITGQTVSSVRKAAASPQLPVYPDISRGRAVAGKLIANPPRRATRPPMLP